MEEKKSKKIDNDLMRVVKRKPATSSTASKLRNANPTQPKLTKKELEAEVERLRKREERLKNKSFKERERLLREREKAIEERERLLESGATLLEDSVANTPRGASKTSNSRIVVEEEEEEDASPFSFKLTSEKIHHHAHIGDDKEKVYENKPAEGVKEEPKVASEQKPAVTQVKATKPKVESEEEKPKSLAGGEESIIGSSRAAGGLFDRLKNANNEINNNLGNSETNDAINAEEQSDITSETEQTNETALNSESELDSEARSESESDTQLDNEEASNEELKVGDEIDVDTDPKDSQALGDFFKDLVKKLNEKREQARLEEEADNAADKKYQTAAPQPKPYTSGYGNGSYVAPEKDAQGGGSVSKISFDEIKNIKSGSAGDNTTAPQTIQEQKSVNTSEGGFAPDRVVRGDIKSKIDKFKTTRTGQNIKSSLSNPDEKVASSKKKISKKALTWILASAASFIAIVGIVITVVFVIINKKNDAIVTATYSVDITEKFNASITEGDRINLTGSMLVASYSDGSREEIEISNENILPSETDDYKVINGHILIDNWKTDEVERKIGIIVGIEGNEASKSIINIKVTRNVLEKIYVLDGTVSLGLGDKIPELEVFAKYYNIDKAKKLSDADYELRIAYLKSNNESINNKLNRSDYVVNSGDDLTFSGKDSVRNECSKWELRVYAVSSNNIVIKDVKGKDIYCVVASGNLKTKFARIMINEFSSIFSSDYSTISIESNAAKIIDSDSHKENLESQVAYVPSFSFTGDVNSPTIYQGEKQISSLELKNVGVIYNSDGTITNTDVDVVYTDCTVNNFALYTRAVLNGSVPNETSESDIFILVGRVDGGTYNGKYVVLGLCDRKS